MAATDWSPPANCTRRAKTCGCCCWRSHPSCAAMRRRCSPAGGVAAGCGSGEGTAAACGEGAMFDSDLLIDAILGTGFHPPVSGLYAEAIAAMNANAVPYLAVDIPSGAGCRCHGRAGWRRDRSRCCRDFYRAPSRPCFGMLTPGPTVIAPIGSPDEAIVSALRPESGHGARSRAADRAADSGANKGNFGHVLVIGGSTGKAGAAAMAGMSALRAGAGLSTVATPKSVLPTVAGFHPELMTEPLEETEAGSISERALGMAGWMLWPRAKPCLRSGRAFRAIPRRLMFVRGIIKKYSSPLVLDADGLNAFEGRAAELKNRARALVITPHPGEMARLIGSSTPAAVQQDRLNIARTFAREHEVIVVLKGHRTLMAAARRYGLGEHDRQSRHGNRRHRRHTDRHGLRPDRAASGSNCRGGGGRGSSPRNGRRCGAREHGRAFDGRNRSAPGIARGISQDAGRGTNPAGHALQLVLAPGRRRPSGQGQFRNRPASS